ncbi:MAG TPA: MotA/TolQ/ExbB proton channel family protein [Pirellulaceae bacterium]|nr:MotA/TolQ/ExbB proton channel family protein [Pirellulaceae bacterium]
MKKSLGLISVLASLLVPISWGLILYFSLCVAIESRWLDHELLSRYILGHPVSQITTAMLCVGLASLFQAFLDSWHQLRTHRRIRLDGTAANQEDETGAESTASDEVRLAKRLLTTLNRSAKRLHGHLLFRRLQAALTTIGRNGANDSASTEMRTLSESDAVTVQQRHALVRILIWATPMLGFLGTVMGISLALGNLNVGPDNDLQQMMGGLQSSLYVAFDTTALALVFSMVLMFALFFVERVEGQLLKLVDERTQAEIDQYFVFSESSQDPHQLVRTWGRRMLAATRHAVREQSELWRESMRTAEHSWVADRQHVSAELQGQLQTALHESLTGFAKTIGQTVEAADQRLDLRWQQWQTMLSESARQLEDRQQVTVRQAEIVSEILARLENLSSIQQGVNRSLEALAATNRIDSALTALTQSINQLRTELRMDTSSAPARPAKPFRIRIAEATRRAA